jgi:hypothetical protein
MSASSLEVVHVHIEVDGSPDAPPSLSPSPSPSLLLAYGASASVERRGEPEKLRQISAPPASPRSPLLHLPLERVGGHCMYWSAHAPAGTAHAAHAAATNPQESGCGETV